MGGHEPEEDDLDLPSPRRPLRPRPLQLLHGEEHGQALDPGGLRLCQEQRVAVG